jgi:hypothetical protein
VKPTPTAKPKPTASASQIEAAYKSSTTNTTVETLDKEGSAYQGKEVHFTAHIIDLVKDSSGNTAGANVDNLDSSSSSVVQVAFPDNTDISRINQDDTIEVWGIDDGVVSGQNAYGGTVQGVDVSALYMTDTTTGYQANG